MTHAVLVSLGLINSDDDEEESFVRPLSILMTKKKKVLSVPEAHYYKSRKYLNLDMLPNARLCLRTVENEYETSKNRRKCLCLLKNEKMENAENREREDADFSFKAEIFDAENDDCNAG